MSALERLKGIKALAERCRAYHPEGAECQCDGEAGHEGAHYFTTSVEWYGCWSCGVESCEEHGSWCEAVLDAIDRFLEEPEEEEGERPVELERMQGGPS